MFIDKYRETVKTSALNIPERLKQIDKGYFLVFNHRSKEFEVHHREQRDNTFCLNIPYKELDVRTLELVKRTRMEYAKQIFKEMEENNLKIEREADKKRNEYSKEVLTDIHKYVTRHESKDTIPEDSSLFKGVI